MFSTDVNGTPHFIASYRDGLQFGRTGNQELKVRTANGPIATGATDIGLRAGYATWSIDYTYLDTEENGYVIFTSAQYGSYWKSQDPGSPTWSRIAAVPNVLATTFRAEWTTVTTSRANADSAWGDQSFHWEIIENVKIRVNDSGEPNDGNYLRVNNNNFVTCDATEANNNIASYVCVFVLIFILRMRQSSIFINIFIKPCLLFNFWIFVVCIAWKMWLPVQSS